MLVLSMTGLTLLSVLLSGIAFLLRPGASIW